MKTQMWYRHRDYVLHGNCWDFTGETVNAIYLEEIQTDFYLGPIPAETTHLAFYLDVGPLPSIEMWGSYPWYRGDSFNIYR